MPGKRYTRVAITLHWLIAFAVIAMVPMGLWMTDAIADPQRQTAAYQAFQLHKSLGLTILLLTLLRLGWRLAHPVPPLPGGMMAWEAFAARAVHAAFYALLLALPLTGWLYVSTGWIIATDEPLAVVTSWFGLVPVPHLPGVAEAAEATRRSLAHGAMGAHEAMAWGGVALFALHVGAALKHQFLDRDGVLGQMLPFLRRDESAEPVMQASLRRPAGAYGAGVLLVAVLAGAGWALSRPASDLSAPNGTAQRPEVASPIDIRIEAGTAPGWDIDYASSSIAFSGTHAGSPFSGQFEDWEGHIWFDPEDLSGSRATVLVQTGSARTGDATQEGSLGEAEWLAPDSYPVARFDADEFAAIADGKFQAKGTLQLKAATVPVTLLFSFASSGNSAQVEGTAKLDREQFDLGLASDPRAQWVSQMIDVTIAVSATRD